MTGKQQAVLWLGLGLVVIRFFTITGQFRNIWAAVTTPGTQSSTPSQSMAAAMNFGGTVPQPATPAQPTSPLNA